MFMTAWYYELGIVQCLYLVDCGSMDCMMCIREIQNGLRTSSTLEKYQSAILLLAT